MVWDVEGGERRKGGRLALGLVVSDSDSDTNGGEDDRNNDDEDDEQDAAKDARFLSAGLLGMIGHDEHLNTIRGVVLSLTDVVLNLRNHLTLEVDEGLHVDKELVELDDALFELDDVSVLLLDEDKGVLGFVLLAIVNETRRKHLLGITTLEHVVDLVVTDSRVDDFGLTMDAITIAVLAAALDVLELLDHVHELLAEVGGEVLSGSCVGVSSCQRLVFVCQALQPVPHVIACRIRLLNQPLDSVAGTTVARVSLVIVGTAELVGVGADTRKLISDFGNLVIESLHLWAGRTHVAKFNLDIRSNLSCSAVSHGGGEDVEKGLCEGFFLSSCVVCFFFFLKEKVLLGAGLGSQVPGWCVRTDRGL